MDREWVRPVVSIVVTALLGGFIAFDTVGRNSLPSFQSPRDSFSAPIASEPAAAELSEATPPATSVTPSRPASDMTTTVTAVPPESTAVRQEAVDPASQPADQAVSASSQETPPTAAPPAAESPPTQASVRQSGSATLTVATVSPPVPTAAPSIPTVAPGTILLSDDFSEPDFGRLPRSSNMPGKSRLGYADGEYLIEQLEPDSKRRPAAWLPGSYANASIALDARLEGPTQGRYLAVGCRSQPMSESHYRLVVVPDSSQFALTRWDRDNEILLTPWIESPLIRPGNQMNRVELRSSGSEITVSINGAQLSTVQDSAYLTGSMWIGAGSSPESSLTVQARFDNLVVAQQ
jgi:hypothetical protein